MKYEEKNGGNLCSYFLLENAQRTPDTLAFIREGQRVTKIKAEP